MKYNVNICRSTKLEKKPEKYILSSSFFILGVPSIYFFYIQCLVLLLRYCIICNKKFQKSKQALLEKIIELHISLGI
jgi:hypothetical protein